MSTARKLGVFSCLLGFLAVCVLALVLNTSGPFAGLPGIESELADTAEAIVEIDAPGARVTADGRDLSVQLPGVVESTYDRQRLEQSLKNLDGVRSVELLGEPTIAVSPDDAPSPQPTIAPEPTAAATANPAPTVAPVPEPTDDPTGAPEATADAASEPTATPEPASLAEIVGALDLSGVTFEPGTSRFTAQDTAVLDVVADQLQGQSGGPIEVQAHTDNLGDPDAKLLLSQDRAKAVVAYLIDRGVDASLLSSRGFGAQVPIADNATEQGRASNQRVVLVVEGN